METVGIDRPTSDQNPAGHRGNDEACRYTEINATRETRSARGAPPQPDAREGQAGPPRVTERPIVPSKPGNSGEGRGPWLKANARSTGQQGDWNGLTTAIERWEDDEGVRHHSDAFSSK